MPTPVHELEQHAKRLVDPSISIEKRHEILLEIRENLDAYHITEYSSFLKAYFEPFQILLTKITKPQMMDTSEYKLRQILLETLNRLPFNETFRPHGLELAKLTLHVMTSDNEESALQAIKILFDLVKTYKSGLEGVAPIFLQFVQQMYENCPGLLGSHFEADGGDSNQPPGSSRPPSASRLMLKSTRSFRIMAETPLLLVLMFQVFSSSAVNPRLTTLLPHLLQVLALPGPKSVPASQRKLLGEFRYAQIKIISVLLYLMKPKPELFRGKEESLAGCIVKLMANCPEVISYRKELLTIAKQALGTSLRSGFSSHMDALIDENVLLGRNKHHRVAFRPLAFLFLSELVLVVRFELSLSQLSRIIHILSRNIQDCTVNIGVQTVCVKIVANLVETIFSKRMVPRFREDSRALLGRTLDALVTRIISLKPVVEKVLREAEKSKVKDADHYRKLKKPGSKFEILSQELPSPPTDPLQEAFDCKQLLKTLILGLKTLTWSIGNFNSNGQLSIPVPSVGPSGMNQQELLLASGMVVSLAQSLALFKAYDGEDLFPLCGALYAGLEPRDASDLFSLTLPAIFEAALKDRAVLPLISVLLSTLRSGKAFADVLAHFLVRVKLPALDPLKDPSCALSQAQCDLVFHLFHMLFDTIAPSQQGEAAQGGNPAERWLQRHVAGIMGTCVERLSLGMKDGVRVGLGVGEGQAGWPLAMGYLRLLRMLFEAMAHMQQEESHKEFSLHLDACFSVLLEQLGGPLGQSQEGQRLLVQLCLCIPVKNLSLLVMHLTRIAQPLLIALRLPSSDPLVSQAIRFLDEWVVSVPPSFLVDCLAPHGPEVIAALCAHLRPDPAQPARLTSAQAQEAPSEAAGPAGSAADQWLGLRAASLLGRFGGCSRALLLGGVGPGAGFAPLSDCKDNVEHGLRLVLTIQPDTAFLVPLDRLVILAQRLLAGQSPPPSLLPRQHALRFLKLCLLAQLNLLPGSAVAAEAGSGVTEGPAEGLVRGVTPGQLASVILGLSASGEDSSSAPEAWVQSEDASATSSARSAKFEMGTKTKAQLDAEKSVFKTLLMTVIAACADKGLPASQGEEDTKFMLNLTRHFAFLLDMEALSSAKAGSRPSSLLALPPDIFMDALVAVLGSERRQQASPALEALKYFLETLVSIAKGRDQLGSSSPTTGIVVSSPSLNPVCSPPHLRVPAVDKVVPRLLNLCYGATWQSMIGGVQGIGALVGRVPVELLVLFQTKIVRALLRVFKFLPETAPVLHEETASVLTNVLRVVNSASQQQARFGVAAQAYGSLLEVLTSELFSAVTPPVVRKRVQNCFSLLASRTASEISELLEKADPKQFQDLIRRPLKAQHLDLQINVVQILTYCLSLRPPLTSLTAEVMQMVEEAMAYVELNEITLCATITSQDASSSLAVYPPAPTATPAPISVPVPAAAPPAAASSPSSAASPEQSGAGSEVAFSQRLLEGVVHLRVACLELLCALVTMAELRLPENEKLRNRATVLFIKNLSPVSPPVSRVAKEGLRVLAHQGGLPKDLLQASMRETLLSLNSVMSLSLPRLQELGYLLELLTTWFNTAIGRKLLDHLNSWTDLDSLAAMQQQQQEQLQGQGEYEPEWRPGEEPLVAAAVLELFHRLPAGSNEFLKDLVPLVIRMERALPSLASVYSELYSPYALPLTKFLNAYPEDAVSYFLTRLADPPHARRFVSVLRSEAGGAVREELKRSMDRLLSCAFSAPEEMPGPSADSAEDLDFLSMAGTERFVGLELIFSLVEMEPAWLASQPQVFDVLMAMWRSPARKLRLKHERNLPLEMVTESPRLVKCILAYVSRNRERVDELFELLGVLLEDTRMDYSFLKDFCAARVAAEFSAQERRVLVDRFVTLFCSSGIAGEAHSLVVLETLVMPVLSASFAQGEGEQVMDAELRLRVTNSLLDRADILHYCDAVRSEMLQLASLLMRAFPEDMRDHRKEVIKLGWNNLKADESQTRFWAYLSIAYFLQCFQAPEKIVLQVYISILRAYDTELQHVVRRALETLLPVLPRRLLQMQASAAAGNRVDARTPIWIRYTRKVLVEDGQPFHSMTHIFHLIAFHQDMYFPARTHFVPLLVNSLQKLGFSPGSTAALRHAALDIVEVILGWENRRRREQDHADALPPAEPAGKRPAQDPSPQEAQPGKRLKLEDGLGQGQGQQPEAPLPGRSSTPGSGGGAGAEPGAGSALVPRGGRAGAEAAPGASAVRAEEERRYCPTVAMQEVMFGFLMRLLAHMDCKSKESREVYERCREVVRSTLQTFPALPAKINVLERPIHSEQAKLGPQVHLSASHSEAQIFSATVDLVTIGLETTGTHFLGHNLPIVETVVTVGLNTRHPDFLKLVAKVLRAVFSLHFPPPARAGLPDLLVGLAAKVESALSAVLSSAHVCQEGQPTADLKLFNCSISSAVQVLEIMEDFWRQRQWGPLSVLENNLDTLLAFATELHKEVLTLSAAALTEMGEPGAGSGAGLELVFGDCLSNLCCLLRLIQSAVWRHASGVRKQFVSLLLAVLGDKPAGKILLTVFHVVEDWVRQELLAESKRFLSPEEMLVFIQKAFSVDKSLCSERVCKMWEEQILRITYRLYTDPALPEAVRAQLFKQVECVWMLGLSAQEPKYRAQFLPLYNQHLERSMPRRLQYVLGDEERSWAPLASSFWIKQALDLLLGILAEEQPITLASNAAKLAPILPASSVPDRPGMLMSSASFEAAQAGELSGSAPSSLVLLLNQHARFLNDVRKFKTGDLLSALRELSLFEPFVPYHLWVTVFPIFWATLSNNEQMRLAKSIISLLGKAYHIEQKDKRPNVVQAILEGVSVSQPQPKLSSDLIRYLGKTLNAWHIVIPLLEGQIALLPNEERFTEALCELYRGLHEEDMVYGLWKRSATKPDTRVALSLAQHGYWEKAQSMLHDKMKEAMESEFQSGVPKAELGVWEEQWLTCARSLGQWDVLADFGQAVQNVDVMVESLWRVPDWTALRESALPKVTLDLEAGWQDAADKLMVHCYSLLDLGGDPNLLQAQSKLKLAWQQCLKQWWQMPTVPSQAHAPILHRFHQLVELQESCCLLEDAGSLAAQSQAQAQGQESASSPGVFGVPLANLLDTVDCWRQRLPCVWEGLPLWSDILHWRSHFFQTLIAPALSSLPVQSSASPVLSVPGVGVSPQLVETGVREQAWVAVKFAHMARKLELGSACLDLVDSLYKFDKMDLPEHFQRTRIQAKALMDSTGDLQECLNVINASTLDYYQADQKAEVLRLKAECLFRSGDRDAANQNFSSALNTYRDLSQGWLSWGHFCIAMFRENESSDGQGQGQGQGQMEAEERPEVPTAWLEAGVNCLLEGIKFGKKSGQAQLASVLYLLCFENQGDSVGRAVDNFRDLLPACVWLPWLPQLLTSFQRPEMPHVKPIVMKLGELYPQAVYFMLRPSLSQQKDAAMKHRSSSSAPPLPAAHSGADKEGGVSAEGGAGAGAGYDADALPAVSPVEAYEALSQVSELMKKKHGNVTAELESLLHEIAVRMKPQPEERLFAVLHQMHQHGYKYKEPMNGPVPEHQLAEVREVYKQCFSEQTTAKYADFLEAHKQEFERDLHPESPNFPKTLGAVTERLRFWSQRIQASLQERMPGPLELHAESRVLRHWSMLETEMPGQYFGDADVQHEYAVKLVAVAPEVPIVRRHGASHRRLTFLGSDGRRRHFLVQSSLNIGRDARSDERVMQLLRTLNRAMACHRETSRRGLAFHTPTILPILPNMRLVEDEPSYSSLAEVYENHCVRYGRDPDLPVLHFKESLDHAVGSSASPSELAAQRLEAYSRIAEDASLPCYVLESVLSQCMFKTLPNASHLWAFKKHFAHQLAITSALAHILGIQARAPTKILFTKNTGQVLHQDFHPVYSSGGQVEVGEAVPLRLTRNLLTFFSQFGVDGLWLPAMSSLAMALTAYKAGGTAGSSLEAHVALFFRDDILAWSHLRNKNVLSGLADLPAPALKQVVDANTAFASARLAALAPQTYEEQVEEDAESGAVVAGAAQSLFCGASALVEASVNPKNLCMMEATWHPWF